MRLFRKLLSATCALAMVMASAFSVAYAEESNWESNMTSEDWDLFFEFDENDSYVYADSAETPIDESIQAIAQQYDNGIMPISAGGLTTESESNDTISSADVLNSSSQDPIPLEADTSSPARFIGRIPANSDTDYIKFTPTRHGVLQITLTPPSGTCLGLYLYDSNGTLLTSSNSASVTARTFRLVTTKKATPDYYYIQVTPGYASNNYSAASYSLTFKYINIYGSVSYPLDYSLSSNLNITCPVGARNGSYHAGLDIPSQTGEPIESIYAGTVVAKGYTDSKGNYVIINTVTLDDADIDVVDPLTNKPIYIRYLHLNSINVEVNEQVEVGTIIGTVGNTGYSDGPHLHIDANSSHNNITSEPGNNSYVDYPKILINLIDPFIRGLSGVATLTGNLY